MEIINKIANNWILTVMLIPIIVAFFQKQIGAFIEDFSIYKNRQFDDDGDPGTGQCCMIQNKATGKFTKIKIIKYMFGIKPSSRKVLTAQKTELGTIFVVYTYDQWKNIIKGSLPK